MVHHYQGCEMWTTNLRKGQNERASFKAVECESYYDCRTEDRFFKDFNDDEKIYHTLITVACTNVSRSHHTLKESDAKKKLEQSKNTNSEYLRYV